MGSRKVFGDAERVSFTILDSCDFSNVGDGYFWHGDFASVFDDERAHLIEILDGNRALKIADVGWERIFLTLLDGGLEVADLRHKEPWRSPGGKLPPKDFAVEADCPVAIVDVDGEMRQAVEL